MTKAFCLSSLIPPGFAVVSAASAGGATTIIVRSGLVRTILRGERTEVFRTRESSLESYLPWLNDQWTAGSRNGADLWRRLRTQGFKGSLRVVTEWATRRRHAERMNDDTLHRIPAARTIARLMTIGRDTLTKAETITVAAVEAGVPLLVEARTIIESFHAMIRRKAGTDLASWIERGRASLVASFANGIARDIAAVRAAIVTSWSNGQTEGQITRLKLVKRQMYGRGKLDLLEAPHRCNLSQHHQMCVRAKVARLSRPHGGQHCRPKHSWLLQPLVEHIRAHVFAADKIHTDDTPVPVLAPGSGKTKTGRLWVYARDDRGWQGIARRPRRTSTRPTAKASDRARTSLASAASCRRTAMQAMSSCTMDAGSPVPSLRWRAGHMSDARSTTCGRRPAPLPRAPASA